MRGVEYLKFIEKTIGKGPYKDTWESLSMHRTPAWLLDAKFGIFIHWGVYAVPAFANEWYPRNMYICGSREFEHHVRTYGEHKRFGYKDFIPLFRGEKFNPDEWAELFRQAGAKYVVPVAEHHDGFQMYRSDLSRFNAFEMGPRRDVLGELKKALVNRGLMPCASSHRLEHWFFLSHGKEFDSDLKEPLSQGDLYWPSMPEPDHQDIRGPRPDREYLEDWLARSAEIVERYRPSLFYFDWWIHIEAAKPFLKKFAAYYYDRAEQWGMDVAITYKHDAFMFGCAVPDVERGHFADLKPYFWQTDTAVARNSWCHTTGNEYKTSAEIIRDLVDIVSKNGCMLLNIGPKADGTIPDDDRGILLDIGGWLKSNGESIYGTSFWRVFGEGPTQITGGGFTDGNAKAFTSEDIRFTVKGNRLYAEVLVYPESNTVRIRSLGSKSPHFHGIIRDIDILGFSGKPRWKSEEDALIIATANVASPYPVVFRIIVD